MLFKWDERINYGQSDWANEVKSKTKHWGVNKLSLMKSILWACWEMLSIVISWKLEHTLWFPLKRKKKKYWNHLPGLSLHRYCPHPQYDTEELFQPKQPNNFQSYQHFRANLVHTWNLANQRFLITSGKSARDMDESSYSFSSTQDSSPLQSVLPFLPKTCKTWLGLPDLSSNLLHYLTHLQ